MLPVPRNLYARVKTDSGDQVQPHFDFQIYVSMAQTSGSISRTQSSSDFGALACDPRSCSFPAINASYVT